MDNHPLIGHETKVLDHGLVKVIDVMGDDAAFVQAARVSYGAGTKTVNEDQGLINHLMRNHHTTPFEMCEIKILCKMPIFVARQWVRHRTANINEYSARYSEVVDEFYIPEVENIQLQSKTNKQGREGIVKPEDAEAWRVALRMECRASFVNYRLALDKGVARELARIGLPLNTYTLWYWKIDIHNLFNFLERRMDSHAQYEIRVYANAIADFIREAFPMAWDAFEQYRLHSVKFSLKEQKVLAHMLERYSLGARSETGSMSEGEWRELTNKVENIKKLK